jgi:hypothetical protein
MRPLLAAFRRDDANDDADIRTMSVPGHPMVIFDFCLDELDRVPIPGSRGRSKEERSG